MAKKSGGGISYPKSKGKQALEKGNDYGAKGMFKAAHSPESVKSMVGDNFSKYKHNEK